MDRLFLCIMLSDINQSIALFATSAEKWRRRKEKLESGAKPNL